MTEKTVRAYTKGIPQAPRKVAIVASLIKNRSVDDALIILSHVPRRPATAIKKALESARANALHNHNLQASSLRIKTISATVGERMKRYMPASRGRALPFQKKSTNLLIELIGQEKSKPIKKETSKAVKKEKK